MAKLAEADILVGSSRSVGDIRIDPGTLRGEGGPAEPRLVVPISITLDKRGPEDQLALVQLTATLHLGNENDPNTRLGVPVTMSFVDNMPCRSLGMTYTADFRFPLMAAAVVRVEEARHAAAETFELRLALEPIIAWLQTHGEIGGSPTPFGTAFGLHSTMSLFWTTDIHTMAVGVEPSVWIKNVLPGLGLDRVRLIELTLPPALPDIGNGVAMFDKALLAFDRRQYTDVVEKCRGLIQAWNKQLHADKKKPLAAVVRERSGWPEGDPRSRLLDAIWQGLTDVANAPHHPESNAQVFEATAQDARLHLFLTAVVSEYIAGVLAESR